jgi:putative proteasome-type protease
MIRGSWGQKLRDVFESLEDPQWGDGPTSVPLCVPSPRYEPMKKITHPGEKVV